MCIQACVQTSITPRKTESVVTVRRKGADFTDFAAFYSLLIQLKLNTYINAYTLKSLLVAKYRKPQPSSSWRVFLTPSPTLLSRRAAQVVIMHLIYFSA